MIQGHRLAMEEDVKAKGVPRADLEWTSLAKKGLEQCGSHGTYGSDIGARMRFGSGVAKLSPARCLAHSGGLSDSEIVNLEK